MQLPHLETFAEAAERSSFTAAARALGLSQAAVSQRVQALEQALGVPLFQRRAGRVLLTDAGRRLHGYARHILELHHEARAAVGGRPAPPSGELSLAASSVPGEHLLPALLSTFRREHPHVRVRVTVADTAAVLELVEHGRAHLGLVGGRKDNPHLEYRCFGCDSLVLVVPAGHPWARRRSVSVGQLCRQPLILREPGSGSRWCLEQALARSGKSLSELHVAIELGSSAAIKEAVQRGLGLAVVSRQAVARETRRGGSLHALRVTGLALRREVFAVCDRRRALPIPARLFLDLLPPCRKPGGHKRRL
jgi:DNA-binding transcriptional LysR family regulator